MKKYDIEICAQLRPCLVRGKKAMFHRWADSARPVVPRGIPEDETEVHFQMWSVHGIVEFEDGIVDRVWPYEIQFVDTFDPDAYDWGENRRKDQGVADPWPFEL